MTSRSLAWRMVRLGGVAVLAIAALTAWMRGSSAELDSILSTAAQQLDRNDYQAAIRTLDGAPEAARADERFQVLSARAYARAAAAPDDRRAPLSASTGVLQGFRILIYPVEGTRADKARAEVLHRKLVEVAPADVEIRAQTREFFARIQPPSGDEIRFDASSVIDERAARALQRLLRDAALGEFTLRDGADRGAGTLSVLFASAASRRNSN